MTMPRSDFALVDVQLLLRRWHWPLVALFFALVTCLWFAPLLPHLGTHVLIGPSDATNGLRTYWGSLVAGETPFTFDRDPLNGAPEGYPQQTPAHIAAPIQPAFIILASELIGLTAALNLFILIGFVATSVTGYILGQRVGFSVLPSLFLGYVVAFNPWMFRRAFDGHVGFVHGWVLLLVVIAALLLIERESIRAALFLGASVGLAFWMASYFGLFASLPAALALLFVLVRGRDFAERLWTCTLACAAIGVTAVMLLPGAIAYFARRDQVNQAMDNPVEQLQTRGAHIGSYLLPTEQNPAFGWITRALLDQGLDERLVFFGYSTMFFASYAVFLLLRRKVEFDERQRTAVAFAAVLAPLAILCSLPRLVHIGSLSIPSPAYLGGEITTFYRFYVRFGYIAGIAFALLAAAALFVLLRRRSYWIVTAAVALMVVELVPARVTTWDAANPPEYVRWLAEQPRGIVAHYPLYTDQQPAIDLARSEYYYQRFHGQPQFTVFGSGYGLTWEHAIRVFARYITDPLTPGVLASEGVRYVVLHDDVYRAQREQPPNLGEPQFKARARFPNTRIFEVRAEPIDLEKTLYDNAASIALTQGLPPAATIFGGGFEQIQTGHRLARRTGAELRLRKTGSGRFFELRIPISADEVSTVTLVDDRGSVLSQVEAQPGSGTLLVTRVRVPRRELALELSASSTGVVIGDVQAAPLADLESRVNVR